MIARLCLLVFVGMCGACSRSEPPPPPAPLTAQPSTPPAPVQLGEAPRVKPEQYAPSSWLRHDSRRCRSLLPHLLLLAPQRGCLFGCQPIRSGQRVDHDVEFVVLDAVGFGYEAPLGGFLGVALDAEALGVDAA